MFIRTKNIGIGLLIDDVEPIKKESSEKTPTGEGLPLISGMHIYMYLYTYITHIFMSYMMVYIQIYMYRYIHMYPFQYL
jgi:hypothetical protein